MYYFNGSIDVFGTETQANGVLDFLYQQDGRFYGKKLWNSKNDIYSIDVMMDGPDLRNALEELVAYSREKHINIVIDVRYTGVDAGGYYYREGISPADDGVEILDEQDLIFRDASDERILQEVARRTGLECKIFEKVKHAYFMDDAREQLNNYYNETDADYPEDFLSTLADKFQAGYDGNIDDNTRWQNLIQQELKGKTV